MGNLSKLPNIGAKLEKQLFDVGIISVEELKNAGSREAWLRILQQDPTARIMRLFALEGAIQNVRWHCLNDVTKESLKDFYHKHKGTDD
ncbi:MAG TPA: TfoX/Sxy family protein [Clostridiales bacterium]|nr:TfoX/Sxy family protein [Clostridiales bacterium]